ncbi:MAG: hypothetical protein GY755_11350 [Chloroflexi bacterium]|nr:hypothetical protein [Chloroflexota bacterium]
MKKLYEIPNTDTAYTVEELIGMVIAGAMVMKENEELKRQLATGEHQLDLLGGDK